MRILIATSHRDCVGGIERYLQAVIPGLLDRGHEVALLHEKPFRRIGESIDPTSAQLITWCAQESPLPRTLASIGQWGPGLVYSQGLEDAELEDALLQTYPVVLYAHNYQGSCISGTKCHSYPDRRPCARRFGAACLALYYPRRCGGWNPVTMWRMYQRQSQIGSRLSGYRAIFAASRHMLQELTSNGARPEQVRLLPLPAAERVTRPEAFGQKHGNGNILFLGRVTNLKGADYLVRALGPAARELGRPLRLTIAGDGPELERVRSLAEALGVAVTYAGWLGKERVVELTREAELVAVPSLWPEPFGLVGIEAGSLGVPAVGFAVGGIPDWLIPGVTGELASGDPPQPEGLAAAIVRALYDPDHYRTICQGAWEMAAQFTLNAHMAGLEPALIQHAGAVCAEEFKGQFAPR